MLKKNLIVIYLAFNRQPIQLTKQLPKLCHLLCEIMETMSKEELMDKLLELQDLMKETRDEGTKTTVPPPKRIPREFYIKGGRFVMGYMLDEDAHGTFQFTNNKRIIADTKERLEHAGERSDGLCITFNKKEIMLRMFSHTENSLDMMEAELTKKMNECLAKLEDGTLRRPTVRRSQPHKTHKKSPDVTSATNRVQAHHTPKHSRQPSYPAERGYRREWRDNSNYRGYH